MQHGQVPGQAGDSLAPQGGESLGHGGTHEAEDLPVGGQASRVGAAAVQGSGHAGDEGGMISKPAVHVSDPLDREAALTERSRQLIARSARYGHPWMSGFKGSGARCP